MQLLQSGSVSRLLWLQMPRRSSVPAAASWVLGCGLAWEAAVVCLCLAGLANRQKSQPVLRGSGLRAQLQCVVADACDTCMYTAWHMAQRLLLINWPAHRTVLDLPISTLACLHRAEQLQCNINVGI